MFLLNHYSIMCRRHKLLITPDEDTACGRVDSEAENNMARSLGTLRYSPLSFPKACRRYATMDKKKLGEVIIRILPKIFESASLRDAVCEVD